MAFLVAVVLGLAFGAADQQLGSLVAAWGATAAQVSAPWLVLPFLFGLSQQRARRAAMLGLVATASALTGYFVMTYSPLEIHPWTFQRFTTGMVVLTTRGYNPFYIFAGLVTGPTFGYLGQRWRVRRSWLSATLVAGALVLEPAVRWATGQLFGPARVWTIEVATGAMVAAAFTYAALTSRERAPIPGG
jgi:Family of unknown function (DUF6518)